MKEFTQTEIKDFFKKIDLDTEEKRKRIQNLSHSNENELEDPYSNIEEFRL